MSIVDFVKWDTTNPQLVAWKYPSQELSTWTQLIVNDSQEAWLVHEGTYEGPFLGGRHTLSTENIPVLTKLIGLPFGGKSPFTAEVWFINKTDFLDLRWGTSQPIPITDPQVNIPLPVRARAQYGIRVVEGQRFLTKQVGTQKRFDINTITENFRAVISSTAQTFISRMMIERRISVFSLNMYMLDISQALTQELNRVFSEYGVEVVRFNLETLDVDPNDETVKSVKATMASRYQREHLGDNYQQIRSFDVLQTFGQNEGTAGAFLGMGVAGNLGGAMGAVGAAINPNNPQHNQQMQQYDALQRKLDLIRQLDDMRKQGLLTDAEFEAQKKGVLA